MSYTRFREIFKEFLRGNGQDKKAYSLHSFRAEGVTTIVKNLKGIKSKERLLKFMDVGSLIQPKICTFRKIFKRDLIFARFMRQII